MDGDPPGKGKRAPSPGRGRRDPHSTHHPRTPPRLRGARLPAGATRGCAAGGSAAPPPPARTEGGREGPGGTGREDRAPSRPRSARLRRAGAQVRPEPLRPGGERRHPRLPPAPPALPPALPPAAGSPALRSRALAGGEGYLEWGRRGFGAQGAWGTGCADVSGATELLLLQNVFWSPARVGKNRPGAPAARRINL